MATEEMLTALADPAREALDGWELELVFDETEVLAPLAAVSPVAAPVTSIVAPAPHNLVQVAVWPTVQPAPTHCVRLLAASLIGLGSLLAASAWLAGR